MIPFHSISFRRVSFRFVSSRHVPIRHMQKPAGRLDLMSVMLWMEAGRAGRQKGLGRDTLGGAGREGDTLCDGTVFCIVEG